MPRVGYNGKCELILMNSRKSATVEAYNEKLANIKCPIFANFIFPEFRHFAEITISAFRKRAHIPRFSGMKFSELLGFLILNFDFES